MSAGSDARRPDRGSRKHILDWVESAGFLDELNFLIRPSGLVVSSRDEVMPKGAGKAERREARLGSFLWDVTHRRELQRWWLAGAGKGNTPNWDLAAVASVEGKPAMVLVEAKANCPELSIAGKPAPRGKQRGESPSQESLQNHLRIAAAIAEADAALNDVQPGFSLRQDKHYQLSNRMAFAWKLASLGIPTVLIYLGFTGDEGIRNVGEPFEDEASWRDRFWNHASAAVPRNMEGRWLGVGPAGLFLLVAARACIEPSPDPIPGRRRAVSTQGAQQQQGVVT